MAKLWALSGVIRTITRTVQLRKAALALPETEGHFGMVSFQVRGMGFADLGKEADVVDLQLPDEVAEQAVHTRGLSAVPNTRLKGPAAT